MKTKFILFAISFFIFISCLNKKEKDAIKLTFEIYKNAVKSNSDSISFLIDEESKNALIEFERLIKVGSQKDKDVFIKKQNAPLTWKYLFLTLNSIISKTSDLDTANLNFTITLFSLAGIKIFNANDIDNFEFNKIVEKRKNEYIAEISVKNYFTSGSNKVNILVKFPFRKENDKWKINVISYFNLFDKAIIFEANKMNMLPEDYIRHITANMK